MQRLRFSLALLACLSTFSACGDSGGGPDATVGDMTTADGPHGTDGGDASTTCVNDTDCSDGMYCDGVEGCSPGAAGADARGCVASTTSPCLAGQTCDETTDRCATTSCTTSAADADGDGHRSTDCGGDDCDDADPSRYPGNHEICDASNRDEDCDTTTFGFRDNDMDTIADARCCNTDPGGAMHCGTDCDDANPGVHPSATETCNGLDDNCNGMTDEGVLHTYAHDSDGDGYGTMDAAMVMMACTPPPSYVENATDCDDATSSVSPAAPEVCDVAMVDENCNGVRNEGCSCTTGDSRMCMSAGVCLMGTETCVAGTWAACSITAVPETCNGLDDDCNGIIDDTVQITCFVDADDDGYAAGGATVVLECPDPARVSRGGCRVGTTNQRPVDATTTDCNDGIAAVYPSATEVCNGRDDNCNGSTDEGVGMVFYADCDGDGHGTSATSGTSVCSTPRTSVACSAPSGYVVSNDDCDDGLNNVFPGHSEACDCLDNNCNGTADEGVTAATTYHDADGDTWVDMSMSMMTCCPPAGYVANPHTSPLEWDCNDSNNQVHPHAPTQCAMMDWDCDGTSTSGATTWYADCDHDGWAAMGAAMMAICEMPTGAPAACPAGTWESGHPPSAGNYDCNDADPGSFPFNPAGERCDYVDNDCDGHLGVIEDVDQDGYPHACPGLPAPPNLDCVDTTATVTTPIGTHPTSASIHPTAAEIAGDGFDESCDGFEDCFVDADADGYRTTGTTSTSDIACTTGALHATSLAPTDCCDLTSAAHPGATGWYNIATGCGTFDYDCSGVEEKLYPIHTGSCTDSGDGLGTCATEITPGYTSSPPACGLSASYQVGCRTVTTCPAACAHAMLSCPDECGSATCLPPGASTRQEFCH